MKKTTTPEMQQLIQQKLEAFDRMQSEFEASFLFVQDVHGQKRFPSFTVADSVRYLHARWICERKSGLLSVAKTNKEYEGRRCLELLGLWQEGDTASVVDFLDGRLDMLPFPDITRQLQQLDEQQVNAGLEQRLMHGRLVMLHRGMNLMQLFNAIFALPQEQLMEEVKEACRHYGHLPEQLAQQLEEMDSPLYSYVPHQSLAQRNMLVMNAMGTNVADRPADLPGHRSWHVLPPTEPLSPYAEEVIKGYQELVSPLHNNIKADPFVDLPERTEDGEEV